MSRPATSTASSAPNGSGKTTTVRMLLGLVLPTAGTVEVLGARIPKHARSVLYRVGALVEAPAAYGHLGARANLSIMDAAGPGGSRRTRQGAHRRGAGAGGSGRRRPPPGQGVLAGHAAAARHRRRPDAQAGPAHPGRADQRTRPARDPGDPPAAARPQRVAGTTIFLSSHLLAEVEHLCRRVGVVDRGRLVLQDTLAALRAPTGSVVVRTPDPEWAVGVLDGDVRARSGDRLVVRAADPAELNARLVRHGIRITELAEERRSLEEVVLAATTGSSDRVDGAVPPTMGPRAEVLASDDSAWDRPPPGPPMPLPSRRPHPAPTPSEPAPSDRRNRAGRNRAGRNRAGRNRAGRSRAGRSRAGRSRAGRSRAGRSRAGEPEAGRAEAGSRRRGERRRSSPRRPRRSRHDRRRADEDAAPAADVGGDRAHRRAADAGRVPARTHRRRPAARQRAGVPVGGAQQRGAVPGRGAGDRAAAVPAGVGRDRVRRLDRRRGAGWDAALPARPPGGPHPAARREAGHRPRVRSDGGGRGRRDGVLRRHVAVRYAASSRAGTSSRSRASR